MLMLSKKQETIPSFFPDFLRSVNKLLSTAGPAVDAELMHSVKALSVEVFDHLIHFLSLPFKDCAIDAEALGAAELYILNTSLLTTSLNLVGKRTKVYKISLNLSNV